MLAVSQESRKAILYLISGRDSVTLFFVNLNNMNSLINLYVESGQKVLLLVLF